MTTNYAPMFEEILTTSAEKYLVNDTSKLLVHQIIEKLREPENQNDEFYIGVLTDLSTLMEDEGHTLKVTENGPGVLANTSWNTNTTIEVRIGADGVTRAYSTVLRPGATDENNRVAINWPIVVSDEAFARLVSYGKFYFVEKTMATLVEQEVIDDVLAVVEQYKGE